MPQLHSQRMHAVWCHVSEGAGGADVAAVAEGTADAAGAVVVESLMDEP